MSQGGPSQRHIVKPQPPGGLKHFYSYPTSPWCPDVTLNSEIHKNLVRIKAPNSVLASKRKHKNQINHYNEERRVLMANSTVCQSNRSPFQTSRGEGNRQNKHKSNKLTKSTKISSLLPKEAIAMLKRPKIQEQNNTRQDTKHKTNRPVI